MTTLTDVVFKVLKVFLRAGYDALAIVATEIVVVAAEAFAAARSIAG